MCHVQLLSSSHDLWLGIDHFLFVRYMYLLMVSLTSIFYWDQTIQVYCLGKFCDALIMCPFTLSQSEAK